jgi:hypothetical protein
LICRDQYFKQIVEASLGYNEATLQEIIYKNINPQEDITQFGFAKWSKESQEEVLKKLRDDQEIEFEQLKLDLAKDISKEALDSLVVAHIKKLYMKFSQFHSEEMTIDYFKEIIKKFQNVQDDDLQIFAQASYKVCMKRAIQDSPDSYICVRPNQDQKDHCSEHDQYFKELLEFSLAYKESDFKNLFGPDYIHGNYARHINKIGSELGGFAKSLGMVANAAEKNTGCTIF